MATGKRRHRTAGFGAKESPKGLKARAKDYDYPPDSSVSIGREPVAPIDPGRFRALAPGERRLALWAAGRVQMVQGDSRQLVAGAYVALAAMWGSLGVVIGLVGIVIDTTAKKSPTGVVLILVGIALVGVGVLRQGQSRNARKRGEP